MRTAYCFDLDGTLTRQELLPLIASSVGLEDEIEVLTQATIDGFLPFDKSFKLRVRLLRDANLDWIHTTLRQQVELDPHILAFISQHPGQCFVMTGNLDLWVRPVLERLGVRSFTSRASVRDGRLEGVEEILHKGDAVASLRNEFDRIVAVGEGMNDVPMFEAADLRIAYGGVHVPNRVLTGLSDFVVHEGESLCRLLNML
ncbi:MULTISPECIES: HAD-IB family phosphatase [Pseudomonas aeruginosa group]|uniref:HAD-IB family phosphatase n=1 Tax=Pseudomonas aeruginosa group TaxID=136841 RepID=UPI0006B2A130|nr:MULTISPECIES: HAD family phosphatase [Pseudomonas aeruginosa group]VTS64700.1 phosphoserine phosphatase [Streptococcus dysgalactiae subsp. equisimilis]AVR69021.1 HAD family hydrolase [Pseudomonas paraeruginosa]KRU87749.1 HAD family hydrolase [Pseudomonas aeruginosa]KSF73419.1 HAD family hydrolase [Pseudomonas aeruginosa]KSP93988.1 HAD family hydrolase [Pseudomonas aeruginosa]